MKNFKYDRKSWPFAQLKVFSTAHRRVQQQLQQTTNLVPRLDALPSTFSFQVRQQLVKADMSMENPKYDAGKFEMSEKLKEREERETCLRNLENILREKEKWLVLEDLDMSPGCAPGENFIADVLRIVVYGRDESMGISREFRKNFILKKIPESNSLKYKFHDCHRLFENEITAYEVVLPLCQSYLEKKSESGIGELCFPKYYGQCQAFIVLEDLQTKGYQMVNRFKGFSKKECSVILQELSKFHALSFALKKSEKVSFLEMTNLLKETILQEENKTKFKEFVWENSLAYAIRSLTESKDNKLVKVSEKLKQYSGKVYAILCNLIKPNINKFNVICHGDLWNNNIMLRYCDSGYPISVKFIDFQLLRYCSCVLDVMHVLFTSSRPSVQEQHLDQLLAEYYDSLASNLRNLGESIDFTFDEFNAELRSKILFGVFYSCLMYMCITRTSEPEKNVIDVEKETITTESDEIYRVLSDRYHERLRSLFSTLAKFNLF